MHIDLTNGDVYAAAYDKEAVANLSKTLAPDGVAPASASASSDTTDVAKGISYGVDNRVEVYETSYDTVAPYEQVGSFQSSLGGCTATLFTRQHVFTAAHCVWGPNNTWYSPYTFSPRQRGAYGGVKPYGTGTVNYLQFPTAWTANNCHVNGVESCVKYDFAVAGFPANSFSPYPGYVSFASWTDAYLTSLSYVTNIGYPGCGSNIMAPANCESGQAYQDFYCSYAPVNLSEGSTANSWPFSDGANPHIKTSCDMSPGHSGGPIFDPNNRLIGDMTWNECWLSSCTASTEYSGGGTRINNTMFNWMTTYRNQAP